MLRYKPVRYYLLVLLFSCLLVPLVGCGKAANETAAAPAPTPTAEIPDAAITAREIVLNYLRDGANECVPPANTRWRADPGQAPEGFAVYRFKAEDCLMTVSYEEVASTEVNYHVTIGDSKTGFCWQAAVGATGRVQATGLEAEMRPELVTAAAAYCTNQGYSYEIRPQPDGRECGVCIFDDNSTCNAWSYYQLECVPGDIPASEE